MEVIGNHIQFISNSRSYFEPGYSINVYAIIGFKCISIITCKKHTGSKQLVSLIILHMQDVGNSRQWVYTGRFLITEHILLLYLISMVSQRFLSLTCTRRIVHKVFHKLDSHCTSEIDSKSHLTTIMLYIWCNLE